VTDLAPYSDVERMLVAELATFGTTGTVDNGARPFVRALRVGGVDNGVTDTARVVVDVIATTRDEAWEIARQVQQRLISGPFAVPGEGIVDRARTDTGPAEAAYDDPDVRLVTATYVVSSRRSHLA
jgi:hypothetical protein